MTKADIINKIAEDTGLPKKDVAATVEAFMEEIRDCMACVKRMSTCVVLVRLLLSTVPRRLLVIFPRTPLWLLTLTTFPLLSPPRALLQKCNNLTFKYLNI
jgi:DNA-binding protein HU-beta